MRTWILSRHWWHPECFLSRFRIIPGEKQVLYKAFVRDCENCGRAFWFIADMSFLQCGYLSTTDKPKTAPRLNVAIPFRRHSWRHNICWVKLERVAWPSLPDLVCHRLNTICQTHVKPLRNLRTGGGSLKAKDCQHIFNSPVHFNDIGVLTYECPDFNVFQVTSLRYPRPRLLGLWSGAL